METRKKKRISNIIMAMLAVVIVVSGIMAVGITKGWIGGSGAGMGNSEIIAAEDTGQPGGDEAAEENGNAVSETVVANENEDSSGSGSENSDSSASDGNAEDGSGSSDVNSQSDGNKNTDYEATEPADVKTCTIQIRCDTILSNMDDLEDGKAKYVPSNGIILSTSTVQFEEGETVFDVLKRTCSYAGIQLEYSYTPMYESYYIEGINHLYEFDCGPQSGWIYKVNGWAPNYGCSSYTLKDGDSIVWSYTCTGLGKDT